MELSFDYSEEKNEWLKKERNLSFEEIVNLIHEGEDYYLLDNPSSKYPHQKILVVNIDDYPIVLPCVKNGKRVFLKTAFPNREYKFLFENNE